MGFNFGFLELAMLLGVVFLVAIIPIVVIAALVFFVKKGARKP